MAAIHQKNILRNELVGLTERLVQFETPADCPKEIRQCLAFLEKYLRMSGVSILIKKFEHNGKPSVVITTRKTKKPKVFLVGHVDVIDAPTDMFRPHVKNARIYGRGALDMKSGIAAMLCAFRDTVRANPQIDAGLMITSDEEIGGFDGVGSLLDKEGSYSSQFAIILEGAVKSQIIHRQKGVCQLKVSVSGISAHGAYPWLGDNAAEKLFGVIRRVEKEFTRPRDAWISTMTLSKITVPNTSLNRSPDHAEAFFDIRFTDSFAATPQLVLERLSRRVPEAAFSLVLSGHVLNTDRRNSFVRKLQKLTKNVYGRSLPLGFSHGASDGRFFGECGIHCVEFGPNGGGHHGDGEYVDISSIVNVYHVLKEFLLQESP